MTHPKPMNGHDLSLRETEIVELIVNTCLTSQQIAHKLSISVRTVEVHRGHIFEKLDIHCLQQLCKWFWTERQP